MTPIDNLKSEKRIEMEKFFGNIHMTSKKMFTFSNVISDETIILLTNDVRKIKDKYILITGKNTGVFLKNWQLKKLSNHQKGINCYAVKINKKYFTPYTFSFEFNQINFDNRDFSYFYNVAKNQEKERVSFKEEWDNL